MPSWSQIINIAQRNSNNNLNVFISEVVRLKKGYIKELSKHTGRNTILYFSSFLHKETRDGIILDKDINAFMETVYGLDKKLGLDLILHTPGGDLSATEQIIKYLRSIFDNDIRVIVPQMAMSAGSMIAVSGKSIVMGKQSCLGPFDPQINNTPCQSVVREFKRAIEDVENHPSSLGLWQTIISKLTPTFITMCEQADELSQELTDFILKTSDYTPEVQARIKDEFVNNKNSKVHSRHIDMVKCKEVGLHIEDLESDSKMQDLVLSIHHCCMILGENSDLLKIVENNIGGEYSCVAVRQTQTLPNKTRMRM